ncbi:MAG: DUF1697 domain-containing protein [Burkholderiaceae bacterium]|nr:DUF1697 domain-containing protein [Burkholderiaceae bacterium]
MKTWIALLRGVNVGGKNKLPMKELAATMGALGLTELKTYIQSGNVVFRGPDKKAQVLAGEIGAAILGKFGFQPQVLVIDARELAAAASANPFPEAATEAEGRTLHLFFLAKAPAAIARERIEAIRRQSERWQQIGAVFYVHAPEGFGDSKLAAQIEKILGVPATARNWRTVGALLALAADAA